MKKIAILMLLLFSMESIAQTYQQNLEKYWYYRHRLKDKFMYYSGNASYQGSHLPAENMSDTIIRINESKVYDQHYIAWKDGGWWLGHYIGMLAMEYKLLKDNNQDVSETLLELNLALNTYDRLDRKAETCFDNNPEDWNGFFLRDDISSDEEIHFPRSDDNSKYLELHSDYIETCNNSADQGGVMSQDQAIMMFLGLYMAKRFVDDEWVQLKVKWIADAIVGRMHEYVAPFKWWQIRNPVTEEIVPIGGNKGSLIATCWAIAEASGKITNQDEHYGYSSRNIVKGIFDLTQNFILFNFIDDDDPIIIEFHDIYSGIIFYAEITGQAFNAYLTAVLSLLSNDWASPEENIYDWLTRLYNDTKGYFDMPENIGVYPHLPLIAEALYGYNGTDRWTASLIENDFLNTSPPCGAHHYVYELNGEEYHEVTDPPWHTLSLGSPQHNFGNWRYDGEYNMIDYMLLYSAYFMNYLYGEYIPYQKDEEQYPFEDYEIRWDFNGYPDTIWYTSHTCSEPGNLFASRQIDSKAVILKDGGIHYFAGNSIKFLPGFKVASGGCLKAKIDPALLQDLYFIKTYVNTCSGGVLKGSAFTSTQIDSLLSLSRLSDDNDWLEFYANSQVAESKDNIISKKENKIHPISSSPESNPELDNTLFNTPDIKVFPNPSNGVFNILISNDMSGTISITIINSFGKRIFEQKNIMDQLLPVNISDKGKGIYYLKINSDQVTVTHKLVLL